MALRIREAMSSSAWSQDTRSHRPSPRFPARLRGWRMRSGSWDWFKVAGPGGGGRPPAIRPTAPLGGTPPDGCDSDPGNDDARIGSCERNRLGRLYVRVLVRQKAEKRRECPQAPDVRGEKAAGDERG